jgi:hypothetical protein
MTTVALDAFPAYYNNSGNPLSGGKLYTYAAGTLTPLATYTDRGGLTPNANPVVLDSAGRADVWLSLNTAYKLILKDSAGNTIDSVDDFYAGADPAQLVAAGIVPATGGTYTGLVSFTGGATFDGTATQDLATLNSLGIASVKNQNLWVNSDFANLTQAGSVGDGGVCSGSTFALCDTGSVTVSRVNQPQDGIPFALRLTQPDAAPKRIGFVQQITSDNIIAYRGKQLVLVPKLRCSANTTLRVALVAWTGTIDAAPIDVVNNWASTTYTAGNFFIATTSTIAVAATALTAATWADAPVSSASPGGVVAPTTMNNLYMVVWTDTAVAQNVTLDASVMRCGLGTESPLWTPPDQQLELSRAPYRTAVFAANGSFTVPPGVTSIYASGCAGGGGGGGGAGGGTNNVGSGGGGGGAGQSAIKQRLTVVPGTIYAISIGAGGAAGTSGAGAGGAGGAGTHSAIGARLVLSAGLGGAGGIQGNPAITGVTGGAGFPAGGESGNSGSNSIGGGYGGPGASNPFGGGGAGGKSGHGAAGSAAVSASGAGSGGGGGGGVTQLNVGNGGGGGAGAGGFLVIEW